MKKIILVDIDHTLSDAFHRDEMIGIAPWDEYHKKSEDDLPAHDFVEFYLSAKRNKSYRWIGITSRPEKFRALTMQWLVRHGIEMDDLWMRPDFNFNPAPDVKIALCQEKLGEEWQKDILLLIDDNEKVIESFRGAGVTCLQIYNRRGSK